MTKKLLSVFVYAAVLAAVHVVAYAQQCSPAPCWSHFANQPESVYPGTALLLTDGRVLFENTISRTDWWVLTPDSSGSYINGSWAELSSSPPNGYAPTWFASAVLADGKVIIEGGEYNGGSKDFTNQGALYDPATNSWTQVNPPGFGTPLEWLNIGDAPSAVLANGTFMLGQAGPGSPSQSALFDEATLSWTSTGTGKADPNDEEGWTLLPSGDVLTVDIAPPSGHPDNSEIYNPSAMPPSLNWTSAGSTQVQLWGAYREIGPAVLLQNGTVFATGATPDGSSSGNTAIYDPSALIAWSAGPILPTIGGVNLQMSDTGAVLLTNGNVLLVAQPSTGGYSPLYFLEWTPGSTSFTQESSPANNLGGVDATFLMLPNGQVMLSNVEILGAYVYTPLGSPCVSCAPIIYSFPSTVTHGVSGNPITGYQFNGLSQDSMLGDDVQNATNYPLVRITNVASGNVVYCKTHDHSTMGVATGTTYPADLVSTEFDVPSTIETGPSTLVVVANGIPSSAVDITVY